MCMVIHLLRHQILRHFQAPPLSPNVTRPLIPPGDFTSFRAPGHILRKAAFVFWKDVKKPQKLRKSFLYILQQHKDY